MNDTANAIRFVEPYAYKSGEPFRVLPLGKFKRGSRTLDLTPDRLQQMATNYAAGRPRWGIPIYFGHPTSENPDPPKRGNIKRLFFVDGQGLYAEPEYTPDGEGAVKDGQYQYISPGVLWSLAGGEYTDEHGKTFDNVIDHVALTNRPFFGGATQLFSADDYTEGGNAIDAILQQLLKAVYAITKSQTAPTADTQPQEETPVDEQPAPQPDQGNPAPTQQSNPFMKETQTMSDTTNKTEALTVSPDEFAAIKAQADKVGALEAQLNSVKTQADTFAAQLTTERKSRRLDQLKAHCEHFVAIPVPGDELAVKLQALEEADSELFNYFNGLLSTLDTQLTQSDLFSQKSSARQGGKTETFEDATQKVLKEQFNGDKSKYEEAMGIAAKARPDLFAEYNETYAPSRK